MADFLHEIPETKELFATIAGEVSNRWNRCCFGKGRVLEMSMDWEG